MVNLVIVSLLRYGSESLVCILLPIQTLSARSPTIDPLGPQFSSSQRKHDRLGLPSQLPYIIHQTSLDSHSPISTLVLA